MIKYREAREKAPKLRDTWVRVFLLNWWVTPLTFLVVRYTSLTSIQLTVLGCFLGIGGALLLLFESWILGAVLILFSQVLDSMDGKSMRMRGGDDTYRGMWDFLLDGIVTVSIIIGLSFGTWNHAVTWALLLWLCFYFLDMRFAALVFNIKAKLGIMGSTLIGEANQGYGNSRLIRKYSILQSKMEKWKLKALPSTSEAVFLIFIAGPVSMELTGSPDWLFLMIILGIGCTGPVMVGNAILAEKLARRKEISET